MSRPHVRPQYLTTLLTDFSLRVRIRPHPHHTISTDMEVDDEIRLQSPLDTLFWGGDLFQQITQTWGILLCRLNLLLSKCSLLRPQRQKLTSNDRFFFSIPCTRSLILGFLRSLGW